MLRNVSSTSTRLGGDDFGEAFPRKLVQHTQNTILIHQTLTIDGVHTKPDGVPFVQKEKEKETDKVEKGGKWQADMSAGGLEE